MILKRVFIFLVCLSLNTNLFCQIENTDSARVYNYWAKNGTIEMVYAYMQDFLESEQDTLKIRLERKGFQEFKVKFIDNVDKKDPVKKFDELIPFLKDNNWGKTANKFEPIIENLKIGKALNEEFFPDNLSYDNKKHWRESKKRIIEVYQKELKVLGRNSWFYDNIAIVMVICCVFGLLIGALLIYYYSRSRINIILSKEKDKYLNDYRDFERIYLFDYIGLVFILKNSKDRKQSEIDRLKKEISNLKNPIISENIGSGLKINESAIKSTSLETTETLKEEIINKSVEWNIERENLLTVYYFTIPEADGTFKTLNGKVSWEKDCFYKIEVDKDSQKGKLFFISGDFDLKALQNIDFYLNPVCEIENIPDRTKAKRINMLKSGSVILNGDQWKIESDKKLLIRLI